MQTVSQRSLILKICFQLKTDTPGFLNDLWNYSYSSNKWEYINGAMNPNSTGNSSMPGARCCTAGWVDTNSQIIYIHGGRGLTAQSQTNVGAIAGIIEALAIFFFPALVLFKTELWSYNINISTPHFAHPKKKNHHVARDTTISLGMTQSTNSHISLEEQETPLVVA